MAKELILAKYGEMALKGLNRGTFEDILMKNLRRRLKKFGVFKLTRAQSTIYMEPMSEDIDLDEVLEHLQCVFGIAALCRACVCEKTMGDISAKQCRIWTRCCPVRIPLKWRQSVPIRRSR